jgi:hypothetical protein
MTHLQSAGSTAISHHSFAAPTFPSSSAVEQLTVNQTPSTSLLSPDLHRDFSVVVQRTFNPQVVGSNPTGATILTPHEQRIVGLLVMETRPTKMLSEAVNTADF